MSLYLMMASLFIYTLVWCSIHVILGIPTLDHYLPSREAPNVLRLQCISDSGVEDTNARFKFYNASGVLLMEQPTDVNEDYLTYNIAAYFEVNIRCEIQGEYSESVMFYG